jgi:hypothetical protein
MTAPGSCRKALLSVILKDDVIIRTNAFANHNAVGTKKTEKVKKAKNVKNRHTQTQKKRRERRNNKDRVATKGRIDVKTYVYAGEVTAWG